MNPKKPFFSALALLALGAAGCNVGNAPAGMSAQDITHTIDKMTPEQHIKFIESSPQSSEEKAKQIAEIKAKYGLK